MDEKQLKHLLKSEFGFDYFRPGQLKTIQTLLGNHHALAILPTGSGKTLIYQFISKVKPGLVLVISPLLSLMQDQLNRLRLDGEKRVAVISSLVDLRARQEVLDHLAEYHYLFLSPEMVTSPRIEAALRRCQLGLVVIDEAHCVAEWGPDFRPHYLLLKQTLTNLANPLTLMLTATATPRVAKDIINRLGFRGGDVRVIRQSVDRPNIMLAVKQVANDHEKRLELKRLVTRYGDGGIIYFSSRKLATQLAEWLAREAGIIAAPYHAGIDSVERYRIQQQFMTNQLQVICATSAFGMGIDKDDVRYVIHYHLPKSLEAYIQEIGRAGRNGQQALAVLLYAPGDEQLPLALSRVELPSNELMLDYQHHQIKTDELGESGELLAFYLDHGWQPTQIRQLFEQRWRLAKKQVAAMKDYATANACRRQIISEHFGERLTRKPTWCCSFDEPDWDQHVHLPAINEEKSSQQPVNDWRQQLSLLFNFVAKSASGLDSH
ncbi:MAG: RecQ family ATP-dependent DNA helicase [[Lactobacillus] timonensis]|jgi:ATP-dependent DNA helicase RecQ|uniref:RecQ family ATP-dependent DNA helicase n=1 Tax=[Lactobacillus] timonensis TaxID=1970790 RepID=UPI002355DBB2|nr:RecQ family ATP-dependent DNA helicase [[Lactobacillus] timonensis]MCI1925571.1 RecQ family ATP-dependent DNA helicase [[Lactobacillus] timonensis]MCI1956929.1 RecQ family ATP-dependent DNA helicase [[Lactobacillus] timonensis]MCI1969919.1 RecQ family ATP-dependent DNA helicase [[Lactobacillus] timonensis]MCI2006120.1 RecQ family ATP-dependent DNA helicase [[Lactobacillus] timonensis]